MLSKQAIVLKVCVINVENCNWGLVVALQTHHHVQFRVSMCRIRNLWINCFIIVWIRTWWVSVAPMESLVFATWFTQQQVWGVLNRREAVCLLPKWEYTPGPFFSGSYHLSIPITQTSLSETNALKNVQAGFSTYLSFTNYKPQMWPTKLDKCWFNIWPNGHTCPTCWHTIIVTY